jgi:hypothetical protein
VNTPTLVASLVMAAVVALLVAFLIRQMMRGWLRRAQRQAELIGSLPTLPDTVGAATVAATKGLYVGTTLVPHWNDKVAAGDLGFRAKAVLTRYPEGIMLQRTGAGPIWIPRNRSPRSAPSEASRARRSPTTAFWPSGGSCRRAPRSTPDSAPTTAPSTTAGFEEKA